MFWTLILICLQPPHATQFENVYLLSNPLNVLSSSSTQGSDMCTLRSNTDVKQHISLLIRPTVKSDIRKELA